MESPVSHQAAGTHLHPNHASERIWNGDHPWLFSCFSTGEDQAGPWRTTTHQDQLMHSSQIHQSLPLGSWLKLALGNALQTRNSPQQHSLSSLGRLAQPLCCAPCDAQARFWRKSRTAVPRQVPVWSCKGRRTLLCLGKLGSAWEGSATLSQSSLGAQQW